MALTVNALHGLCR